MKKNACTVFLILFFLMTAVFPAGALDISLKVYDEADLFSTEDEAYLMKKALALVDTYDMDVVILTIQNADGKTTRAYADDFFDDNGFGIGPQFDGLLFLIDMDNREFYISTTGLAIRYFTDSRINTILDEVFSYVSEGLYAEGADFFLDETEAILKAGIPQDQYNYDTETGEKDYYNDYRDEDLTLSQRFMHSFYNSGVYLLIAAVISGITVAIMAGGNKGKKTVNASTYLDSQSFHLDDNRDIYIRTSVTKTHIPKNPPPGSGSGGSRSSVHTGSSGRSHGGGGRSF